MNSSLYESRGFFIRRIFMMTWFCITLPLVLLLMKKHRRLLIIRGVEIPDIFRSALMSAYCIISVLFIIFLLVYDKRLDAFLTVAVISFLIGLAMCESFLHNYRTRRYLAALDFYLKYLGLLLTGFGLVLFIASIL